MEKKKKKEEKKEESKEKNPAVVWGMVGWLVCNAFAWLGGGENTLFLWVGPVVFFLTWPLWEIVFLLKDLK